MISGPLRSHVSAHRATANGSVNGLIPSQTRAAFFQPLPGWVWLMSFIGILWGFTTLYPMLIAASCISLPIITGLLLFRGESPILFACCAMQWLQTVTAVFYAAAVGTTMERIILYPELEMATWLSLGGVIVLAVGMRLALSSVGRGTDMAAKMDSKLEMLSISRLNLAWWVSFFIASSVQAVAWKLGGFRQFATPIIGIKWIFFYLLAYRILARDEGYRPLLVAVVVEFISGFTGYFGSFKEVLMMFIIVFATLSKGISVRMRALAVATVIVGLAASAVWSVVKMEYRDFLIRRWGSAGGADFMTRLDAMKEMASRMDSQKLEEGFRATVSRVSYVGLFGSTISWVPRYEPHSHGELWMGAVKHIFMPRFIFQNKRVLDDSDRARRFTGLRLAGMDEGTSIGIGYMAESYADFGRYGMYAPILLLGLLMGKIYEHLCFNKHSTVFGTSIATAVLFSLILSFATSNVKILGSLITLWIAYTALNAVWGAGFIKWVSRN